jgi:hypothetical protein
LWNWHPAKVAGRRTELNWTVRTSVPGPDLPLLSVVLFPDEFRVPSIGGPYAGPGIRLPRRGYFILATADEPAWIELVSATHPSAEHGSGAGLMLREPSGRNHEIRLGWPISYPAVEVDQIGGLTVNWVALDLETLAELDRPRRIRPRFSDPWG